MCLLFTCGWKNLRSSLYPPIKKTTQPQRASLFKTNKQSPKPKQKTPSNISEGRYHLKGGIQNCNSSFEDASPPSAYGYADSTIERCIFFYLSFKDKSSGLISERFGNLKMKILIYFHYFFF